MQQMLRQQQKIDLNGGGGNTPKNRAKNDQVNESFETLIHFGNLEIGTDFQLDKMKAYLIYYKEHNFDVIKEKINKEAVKNIKRLL